VYLVQQRVAGLDQGQDLGVGYSERGQLRGVRDPDAEFRRGASDRVSVWPIISSIPTTLAVTTDNPGIGESRERCPS